MTTAPNNKPKNKPTPKRKPTGKLAPTPKTTSPSKPTVENNDVDNNDEDGKNPPHTAEDLRKEPAKFVVVKKDGGERLGVDSYVLLLVVVHDVGDAVFGSIPHGLVLDAGTLGHDGGTEGLAGDVDGGAAHVDDRLDGQQ